MRRLGPAAALAALLLAVPAGAAHAIPIPSPLGGPLVPYDGAPTTAQPIKGPFPPHNPALAPDGASGTGLEAGNGAASTYPGPLGRGTRGTTMLVPGSCTSMAFDARGRLLAVCNGPLGPSLQLLDPASLATIDSLTLPPRPNLDRTDLAGGTHFIVRDDGSVLLADNAGALRTIAVDQGGLRQTASRSLTGLLGSRERPFAVAAGFDGRDWVVGDGGTVIAVPRDGSAPKALALHQSTDEDLATDPSGTYVVTEAALYRLVAGPDGTPRVVWRRAVPDGLADRHAGRTHPGPGTPPVIVPGGFVAVADGLNPPRVEVMRIRGGDSKRLFCAVNVFEGGHGSIEAPLVVAGHSIVVSNAYGYDSLLTTEGGRTTVGGLARIVTSRKGCRTAWTSREISPSAQAVVSRATGLLYTVIKPKGFPDDWRLAALDWRTGVRRFSVLAGEGLGFNSDGDAVVLGPSGAAYAGSFGGITRWSDAP